MSTTSGTQSFKPTVSILIPVYNEESTIEATVLSAVEQQSGVDYSCEVLISDNCSSDRTADICRHLETQFKGIKFFSQPTNLGALKNMKFLVGQAKGEYVCFIGAHDLVPSGYISRLLDVLLGRSYAVLAYGDSAQFADDGSLFRRPEHPSFYRRLESNDCATRLLGICGYLRDCTLFYGLWRKSTLTESWCSEPILGVDQLILLKAASHGAFFYLPMTYYVRGVPVRQDGAAAQMERISGNRKPVGQFPYLPLAELSSEFLTRILLPKGEYTKLVIAKLHLAMEYGPYSQSILVRIIQVTIWIARRLMRSARYRMGLFWSRVMKRCRCCDLE